MVKQRDADIPPIVVQVSGLDLVRTVGHELKAPLTHIANAASMLKDGDIPSEHQQKHYQDMESSARRMLQLVDSVLFAGQVATDQRMLRLEPTNVASVMHDVAVDLSTHARNYDKQLNMQITQQLAPAMIDPSALNYSLYGLLEMLIRTSDSDTIELLVHHQTDSVMITLRDQGPAFSAKLLEQVLARLGKAAQPIKQFPNASGMALYVALSLTKAMHGDLRIKQRNGQRTLSLKLPLSQQLELI